MISRVSGFDLLDILGLIKRRQRRYLALLLNDLEKIVNDPEEYAYVRKAVLDIFNDYTRSIFRILVGEGIEGLSYR